MILRCFFCSQPITKRNGWIEIYDYGRPGEPELTYPGNGERMVRLGKWTDYDTVSFFSHRECGPDRGYPVECHRVWEAWGKHLKEKSWWCPGLMLPFEQARKKFKLRRKQEND